MYYYGVKCTKYKIESSRYSLLSIKRIYIQKVQFQLQNVLGIEHR